MRSIIGLRSTSRGIRSVALGAAAIAVIMPGVSPSPAAQSSPRLELVLQTGHTGIVTAIALSPDGRFLVSGSEDSTVKIWDITTGNVLRTLSGDDKPVLAIALSHDGRLIASGGENGSVRVSDVITGDVRILGAHSRSIRALAFSADSSQLTSLGLAELILWDVIRGRALRTTAVLDKGNTYDLALAEQHALALTPDGRFAAIGGGFSARGGFPTFRSGVSSDPIRVIETASGREIETFKAQGELPLPSALRFSPDGRFLVAKTTEMSGQFTELGQSKNSLAVYDVTTGREVARLMPDKGSYTNGIGFSEDGKLFAARVDVSLTARPTNPDTIDEAASGWIKLFEVATWREVRELTRAGFEAPQTERLRPPVTPLTFSRNGKLLASSLGSAVALFEMASGARVKVLRTTGRIAALSASPASPRLSEEMLRQSGMDASQMRAVMESVAANQSRLLARLKPNKTKPSMISFSADGRELAATGSTVVWDTVAGAPRPGSTLDIAQRTVWSLTQEGGVAISPDGKLSASTVRGRKTTTVFLTEVATRKGIQNITLGNSSDEADAKMVRIGFNTRAMLIHSCDAKRGSLPGLGGGRDCRLQTFDPVSGTVLSDVKVDAQIGEFDPPTTQAILSSRGRFMASFKLGGPRVGGMSRFVPGIGGGGAVPTQPYTMQITDTESGRMLWESKGEIEAMMGAPDVAFSADDAVVAVTSLETTGLAIKLFETTSGRAIGVVKAGNRSAGGMSLSHDGTWLAIAYGGGGHDATAGSGRAARGATPGENVVAVYDVSNRRQAFVLAHDTPVSDATFSLDSSLIATVGEDRSQYLWDARTGEKLATLVNLDAPGNSSAPDWLVVTPDGLFDGSPGAWQQIMWRFSQNTFDVGPVEIFFNEFYYPGLASEIFSGRRPKAPRDVQHIDRRQPTLTLHHIVGDQATSRLITVKIDVAEAPADRDHQQGSGARDVRLFRNGTLIKLWPGDVLKGTGRTMLEAVLPIVAGENRLTAYAFNRENVKSADAFLVVTGSASLKRKGTAYVLALGVNQYENAQYNLKYARADATAFAAEVMAQQAKLEQFDRVEVIHLFDQDATKANLLFALKRLAGDVSAVSRMPAGFEKFAQTQPEDAVIIYFAGHGTASGARFYLVPHDLGYAGPRVGINQAAVQSILSHSVSDLELQSAVEGLDATQLMLVIDACNSGQALEAEEKRRGPMNSKGLAQLAYEKGIYILTAAQSYQAALETSQLGHGYLTFTLVEEGLKQSRADLGNKDGLISVREWFDYATERVPAMQKEHSETRLLLAQDDKVTDPNAVRNLQSPRAFYRREAEANPVIIGKR